MSKEPVKVLVVGQTPPPYGGQAMMIQRLVRAQFEHVRIYHVRMSFSESFKSIGNFGVKKVFHIFEVAFNVLSLRFGKGVTILYYPPAGPNRNPILRDLILLFLIRPFFKEVIYHFRAAGISEFLTQQSGLFRRIAKGIYGTPDAAIQLSGLNPEDGHYFGSRRVFIIPNGLEDAAASYLPLQRPWNTLLSILFVGVLKEDKGVNMLVESAKLVKEKGYAFNLVFMGEFISDEYETEIQTLVDDYGLREMVQFSGVKTGAAKWQLFSEANLFCFPSFFDSESFGNVVVEAMMFELPVVATYWRGIPDIVVHGETGWLVPIKDPVALSEKLAFLIDHPVVAQEMGKKGRKRYESSYTLNKHLNAMEEAFTTVANGVGVSSQKAPEFKPQTSEPSVNLS